MPVTISPGRQKIGAPWKVACMCPFQLKYSAMAPASIPVKLATAVFLTLPNFINQPLKNPNNTP